MTVMYIRIEYICLVIKSTTIITISNTVDFRSSTKFILIVFYLTLYTDSGCNLPRDKC